VMEEAWNGRILDVRYRLWDQLVAYVCIHVLE
jgi:hypothetical protein